MSAASQWQLARPDPSPRILPPKTCSRGCIDRSGRQLENSGFPDETAIKPKLGSEWSPTARFVSGPAQHPRATRPFVDVQSALCRRATFTPAARLGFWILLRHRQYLTAKQPAFERGTAKYRTIYLICGEVLVAGLGVRLQQAMIGKIFPSGLLDKPSVNLVRVFVKAKFGTYKFYFSKFMEVKRG